MLSVGIITFNEELRLERTLRAVQGLADEIIIVDSFSTDRSVEIAKSFEAKIEQIAWPGYGMQKNNVIERCTKDWILLIDADEVITPELAKEIKKVIKDGEHAVYVLVDGVEVLE